MENQFPPPSYEEVMRADGAGIENLASPVPSVPLRFTFVDFTANCLIERNKFTKCEYEKFRFVFMKKSLIQFQN